MADRNLRKAQGVAGERGPSCRPGQGGQQAVRLALRHRLLLAATSPLPGSVPCDNFRPINVPGGFAGLTLIEFLAERFPNTPREEWLRLIAEGRVVARGRNGSSGSSEVNNQSDTDSVQNTGERLQHCSQRLNPGQIVREGEQFGHLTPGYVEPHVNADIRILYEDESIVIVNKPAPLPMHPCGRFDRNSLQTILDTVYAPQRLRAAHRLDAATSGLVLHSRSQEVARKVQPQFAQRRVGKFYVAKAVGHPTANEFVCIEPIAAATQPGGLRNTDRGGLSAETRFRVLSRNADGTSLIEAQPVTGRTNQIRIHLWSLGLPIKGDSYYLPGGELGTNDIPDADAEPLCLHARSLTFAHPESGETVTFEAPLPGWASA